MLASFIIPARGESKRIPRKNTVLLGGVPLITHTLRLLHAVHLQDVSYVSTEDGVTKTIVLAEGAHVIDRPTELATDSSRTEDVLLHALDVLGEQHILPEWIVTLPPTSPFRQPLTLTRLLEYLESDPPFDAVFAVSKSFGDYWLLQNGKPRRVFPDAPRSQQARDAAGCVLFEENGCFYATRVHALREASSRRSPAPILGSRSDMFLVSPLEGFDINDPLDMVVAEALFAHHVHTAS